jgi:predicted acylesterase/phospholipase RssA/CRP-like cAMP-binding protein
MSGLVVGLSENGSEQITEGNHAEQRSVLDDREMPVAAFEQELPGLEDVHVRGEDVRLGRHPRPHRGRRQVAAFGDRTNDVTFGHDPDERSTVDDGDRTVPTFSEAPRQLEDGGIGPTDERGPTDEIAKCHFSECTGHPRPLDHFLPYPGFPGALSHPENPGYGDAHGSEGSCGGLGGAETVARVAPVRLPPESLTDVANAVSVSFSDGEALVRRGDPADHVLVLTSGTARVETADGVELAVLGAGDLVGELSILAGGTRSADVTAAGPVSARRFDRAAFVQFLEANPSVATEINQEISRRLDEHHIASFVTRTLGLDIEIPFDELRAHLTWRWVRAGERLYERGDASGTGYLVISGRMRVVGLDEMGAESTIAEVGPDEFVGESGLFEARPRRVAVEAIRDTLVAEVDEDAVTELLSRYPRVIGPLMASFVRRSRRAGKTRARRTVALAVTADLDPRVFAARLQQEMSRGGSCAHLWSGQVDSRLSHRGAADAERGDPVSERVAQLLHETELSHDHMLLETGTPWSQWSTTAARHADRLVACVSAGFDDAGIRTADLLYGAGSPHAERVLVVVHQPDAARPHGTAPWAERWNVDRIVHIVSGSSEDMARLGRLLTGRSIGLVLGGGGARGFAHGGVRKALRELGIPIDMIGGTSIGGALGGGAAMNIDDDTYVAMIERLFRGLLDYTIPVVSLVKGEAITNAIMAAYSGWTFEDLWRPFFCVSTNLTRSSEMVHRRGDLVPVIRASVSIPGVMPPVAWGDDLLVDGGVMNNLPADIMSKDVEEGTVIAVNVAPPSGPRAKGEMALSVSGWEALRSKARKGKASYPGITAMLMRTMIAGSMREQSRMLGRGDVDLYLDLDLRGISLLDFENVRPVVQAGYDAAMPMLEEWLEARGGVD